MDNEFREFLNQNWTNHNNNNNNYRTSVNPSTQYNTQLNVSIVPSSSSVSASSSVSPQQRNQSHEFPSILQTTIETNQLITAALSKATNSLSIYMNRTSNLSSSSSSSTATTSTCNQQQDQQLTSDYERKYSLYSGIIQRDTEFITQQQKIALQTTNFPFIGQTCPPPPPNLIGIKEIKGKTSMTTICQRNTIDQSRAHSKPIDNQDSCTNPYGTLANRYNTGPTTSVIAAAAAVSVAASSTSLCSFGKSLIIGNSSSGGGFVGPNINSDRINNASNNQTNERNEVVDSSTPPPSSNQCISSSSITVTQNKSTGEHDKKSANSIRGILYLYNVHFKLNE